MPRGASSGDVDGNVGGRSEFRGAEQSLHLMEQVKSYFAVGMDHVLEVTQDMVECGVNQGDDTQLRKLQQMMLSYARMERDAVDFMDASREVINNADDGGKEGTLQRKLDQMLKQASKGHRDDTLKQHDKYIEFEQKISEAQNPDGGQAALGAGGVTQEEDIEMTQEQVNTKCPYTAQEMKDPVRNVICKHSYDRQGIMLHIKQRGKKAVCPVGGCKNTKPITARDLEENKEMKRYIQNKNKRPQLALPSSSTD